MTLSFQLSVVAYDTTYPKNKAVKYVTITVNRNANAPRFERDNYEKTLTANYPLMTEVIKTNATDEDGVGGTEYAASHHENISHNYLLELYETV